MQILHSCSHVHCAQQNGLLQTQNHSFRPDRHFKGCKYSTGSLELQAVPKKYHNPGLSELVFQCTRTSLSEQVSGRAADGPFFCMSFSVQSICRICMANRSSLCRQPLQCHPLTKTLRLTMSPERRSLEIAVWRERWSANSISSSTCKDHGGCGCGSGRGDLAL